MARIHGDALLVDEVGGRSLTFADAADVVDRWAGAVADVAAPGDRAVIALPNGYDALLACLAAGRAGTLAVPVNPQMREAEIEHVIADSGATLVVREVLDLEAGLPLGAAVPADPDDVAAIFYTSGTTGKPKGARLTHRSLLGQVSPLALWPAGVRRDLAVIGLPVAHIMGFVSLLGMAGAGIPVAFLPKFRPDVALDEIERRRATVFVGVPAMYRMLLEAGAEERDLRSVRVWMSGADVMPPDLARRFQKMGAFATLPLVHTSIGQAAFAEGYGMVEVGGGAAFKLTPPLVPMPFGDSVGIPLPGYRFRVVSADGSDVPAGQVGELWLQGPGVLAGYHGDVAATSDVITDDGWLRTGDLARKGMFGVVQFAGRGKDVIKHGGYSVYAVEVEAALREHPHIADAAVVGIADERKGEVPVAAVELRSGASVSGDEIVEWARERVAAYKAPVEVRVVDELPRGGTDKVQKHRVRELFTNRA